MAERAETRSLEGFPDHASLRRALRLAVESALPELYVVAEGFLAEVSQTDLLAVGAEGELISIRIAAPGGDAEALTHVLADLSWLRPRRADFLKLAPGLGIEPSAEPRALLVARDFRRETLAAADNFPAETVQLWRCRDLDVNGGAGLQIEPDGALDNTARPHRPERSLPLAGPPSPSAFRTGLVDVDLEPAQRPEPGARSQLESHRASAQRR